MPETSSEAQPFAGRPFMLAAAAVIVLLIAGTVALWVHYGSTIFYEMILAGIAACF
jgi:hypothetical protein